MKRLIVLVHIILFFTGFARAADIKFVASANNTVGVGEQFALTFSINAEGSGFAGPIIKNFSVLAGPNVSSSSSIQIINGNVKQSVNYSYTYYLQAETEGTFTIPPASISVGGKRYVSNALSIHVVKGSKRPQYNQPGRSNSRQYQNVPDQEPATGASSNDLFLKAFVDKKSPCQGEQVIITYKIYTKISISQFVINKLSSYTGFWSQDLMKENEKPKQYTETVNGEKYMVAEIRKVALFPQKTGKLSIAPLEIEVLAQVQNRAHHRSNDPFFDNLFDDFFGSTVSNVKKTLRSNSVSVDVKPLPLAGKPAGYQGAVGNFTLKSEIDKTTVKANEAVTLKLSISGNGNLKLIDKLNVQLPPDFETYDPKTSENISSGSGGISGTKTFEYLMIPRNAGQYKIKPVEFSYFDLSKNKYITLSSPEFSINVTKGDGNQGTSVYNSQEDIKYVGNDIRFIKNQPFKLSKIDSYFFGSPLFYIILFIPFLLFILFVIIWKNEIKKRSNVLMMKNRRATKVATARLKKAMEFLKRKETDGFYNEISNALWGYLSDKFAIPLSELSIDSVNMALSEKNVKEEIIKQFIATLNDCEFARFAPGDSTGAMEGIYKEAMDVILKIERELK